MTRRSRKGWVPAGKKIEVRIRTVQRTWVQLFALAVFLIFLFLFLLGRTRGSFPREHVHAYPISR